jgi:hypothetical protein
VCSFSFHQSFQRFAGVRFRCGEDFKCSRNARVEETYIFFEYKHLAIFTEELCLDSHEISAG